MQLNCVQVDGSASHILDDLVCVLRHLVEKSSKHPCSSSLQAVIEKHFLENGYIAGIQFT